VFIMLGILTEKRDFCFPADNDGVGRTSLRQEKRIPGSAKIVYNSQCPSRLNVRMLLSFDAIKMEIKF
jgi:hypothetical protein